MILITDQFPLDIRKYVLMGFEESQGPASAGLCLYVCGVWGGVRVCLCKNAHMCVYPMYVCIPLYMLTGVCMCIYTHTLHLGLFYWSVYQLFLDHLVPTIQNNIFKLLMVGVKNKFKV